MERWFEGEFNRSWKDIAEELRLSHRDWSDERIERAAKDRRNFNTKHLRAYLKGQQIFHFGRNEYNIPFPFVVQAGYGKTKMQ